MGRARITAAWAGRAASAVTCALFLFAIGCGGDHPGTDDSQSVQSALGGTTVSVDQASYAAGATITVSYDGLPGNTDDWIAIAPAGAPNTTHRGYAFTNGQTSGTASLTAPAGGSYVARAFSHNTFALLAESPAFAVTDPTITTDQSSYEPGTIVTVTYAGMPGYANDWIALAPAGAPNTTYRAYVFTNGQTSGTISFTAPVTAGSYVVRAFPRNTFALLTETAPFTVGSPSVTPVVGTDRSSYVFGTTITVTYSGLPGNLEDSIVLTTAGAANTSVLASVFTNGQTSGTATFTAPAAVGSYVIRAFPNNTYDLFAESAPFAITSGATVSVDQSFYVVGATVTVSYAGLPGNADDWIALAPAGAPNKTYRAYVFTNGQTSGTATFMAPAVGSYVARAFPHNTFAQLAESPAFTITRAATVSVDQPSYAVGATVTVSYADLPGNADDWIALAPAGAPNKTYRAYAFTKGQTSGTATFTAPAAGSYVVRAFPHNTFALLAESPAFAVTSPTISTNQPSYGAGASITVIYAGLPGHTDDWIALARPGAANTSFLAYVFTGGQASGTATFAAPADGSYVVRAFPHNTFALLAESPAFTVDSQSATPAVSANQAIYAPGATITVSYSGLPGNPQDTIVLTASGAPSTSVLGSASTNGQTSGTVTFTAPATAGSYVVRAFPNDTYDVVLAESAQFAIGSGPTVSVTKSSYAVTAKITVNYAGLPGNFDDWIALAPAGAPSTTYLAYTFTNGQTSGTTSFTAPAGGSYVVRAFPHNTFALLAESPAFAVAAPTVSTDQSSYAPGATITVTYTGLPGNTDDWIALAAAGDPSKTYAAYVFTNGQTSGTATFTAPADGSYVVRAFPHNTFALLAESATFAVVH